MKVYVVTFCEDEEDAFPIAVNATLEGAKAAAQNDLDERLSDEPETETLEFKESYLDNSEMLHAEVDMYEYTIDPFIVGE